MILLCLAIGLHDADGPIYCRNGTEIRLAGIGATELDGRCRPNQPCVPGDPVRQRRALAAAIGATPARETRATLFFAKPVRLRCAPIGRSYRRTVAWCALPDARDVSCLAIRTGVAKRWPSYDRGRRLVRCRT